MKSLVFNFSKAKFNKEKINKKFFSVAIAVALIAAVLTGYFLLSKTTKTNLLATISHLFSSSQQTEKTVPLSNGQAASIPSLGDVGSKNIYQETAKEGDSITTLARRALSNYLKENNLSLSPEKRIYIEDYLQKKTGDYWLNIGQKITFSQTLIKEAISHSQELTNSQLNNLHQYAVLVSF